MNPPTDVRMFSDEILMALGVKFEAVDWSETPQPNADASAVVDRALDELVSNALAIRTVALNGVVGVASLAREAIRLRQFVADALCSPQASVYNDEGWQVHLTIISTGEINQVELYRRAITLSDRFQ